MKKDFDTLKEEFIKEHPKNAQDYIILGLCGRYLIIKHNTPWCHRVYTIDVKHNAHLSNNCRACYLGISEDKNIRASRNLKNKNLILVSFNSKKDKSVFYCKRCKHHFKRYYDKDFKCPVCKEITRLRNTLLKIAIKKGRKNKKLTLTERLINYNKRITESNAKIVYHNKNFYYVHHCLDGHIRVANLGNYKVTKRLKNTHCKECKRIRRYQDYCKKIEKANKGAVVLSRFNWVTEFVTIKLANGLIVRIGVKTALNEIKYPRLSNIFNKDLFYQLKLDKKYGKGTWKVKKILDDNHLLLSHSKCNHEDTYLIDSLFTTDVRCKGCHIPIGEQIIINILRSMNLSFEYPGLIGAYAVGELHYDFYIPSKRMLIEYDGYQHFHPVSRMGGENGFIKRQEHDRIKNEYALEHGYRLLRINNNHRSFSAIKRIIINFLNSNEQIKFI